VSLPDVCVGSLFFTGGRRCYQQQNVLPSPIPISYFLLLLSLKDEFSGGPTLSQIRLYQTFLVPFIISFRFAVFCCVVNLWQAAAV
jgi:hypothetical protein